MTSKQIIYIKENESFSLSKSSKELKYIKKNFNNCFTFTTGKKETILTAKNIVGILDVGNTVYRIYPKVGDMLNIFRMINKVQSSTHPQISSTGYLTIDSRVNIDVEGDNKQLVEVILLAFLKELDKVKKRGYTKCYLNKEDNIVFLRGKLNISKQIKKNYLGNKFYCKYNELLYYTPENIITFLTLEKIIKRYKISKDLRGKLLKYLNEFKQLLQVDGIKELDIQTTKYLKNRNNAHYQNLVSIAMLILNNNFASSVRDGKSKFCNFMIKIDLLFEQYIFVLLDEILNSKYTEYYAQYQYTIKNIVKIDNQYQPINNLFLKMDADIVLFERETNKPILVIDTKYIDIYKKNKLNNYAYYQMISYLMGLSNGESTNLSAILLAHGNSGNSYKIPYVESNMYILTKGINILEDENNLKNELTSIIEPFLNVSDQF